MRDAFLLGHFDEGEELFAEVPEKLKSTLMKMKL